MMKIFFWWNT